MTVRRPAVVLLFLAFTFILPAREAPAVSDAEKTFLSMYFKDEELVVLSTTRSLKSVTRVAENVSVVTAEDMELMNAHTVADALFNVTGIEIPAYIGSQGFPQIHGTDAKRIAVLLDGVPLQNANNLVALGVLPVQMVRRIEIIKGPASATWGSSFGGVINIITKSVEEGDRSGGTVYASGGERNTSDVRAELRGRKDRFGIYLFGGTLNSDGMRSRHELWHDDFFAKVNIDAGCRTKLDLSFLYQKSDGVNYHTLPIGPQDARFLPGQSGDAYNAAALETLFLKAGLQRALGSGMDMNLSAWMLRRNDTIYERTLISDISLLNLPVTFNKYGFSGSFSWRAGRHTLVAGTDLMNGRVLQGAGPVDEIVQRKYAFFINDTIDAGGLSISPGMRYDHTNLGGEMVSPRLGMTWLATKDLLFRALVSRGFHDPAVLRFIDAPPLGFHANMGLKSEKVWSYQAGAEANLHDLLDARVMFIYQDIDDLILDKFLGPRNFTLINGGSTRTTGGEFEIVTKKYKGFVLKGGFHYERVRLIDTNDIRYFDVSKIYGFNATLTYNEDRGLGALLQGHYLWWSRPEFWQARYNGVVVDFNIIKGVLKKKDTTIDLFFTAHNIFNGSSYGDVLFKNPDRWLEAGLRTRF